MTCSLSPCPIPASGILQPQASGSRRARSWPADTSLRPGITCPFCCLSPQSSTGEWCHGKGNYHYEPGWLNMTRENYHRVGRCWTREQRNDAEQEKCLLSPELFFLFLWPKSSFAIQLVPWEFHTDGFRVVAWPMELKIKKSPISFTQEIRELASTLLSANSSAILDHLYDLVQKFCLQFKD